MNAKDNKRVVEGEDAFGTPKFLERRPEVIKEENVGEATPKEAQERRPL